MDSSVDRTITLRRVKVPHPKATRRDMNRTSFLPSPFTFLAIAMIDSAFFIMIDLNKAINDKERIPILNNLRKAIHIASWLIFVMWKV